MTRHYGPSGFLGEVASFCILAADQGGSQWRALSMVDRPEELDPQPGLMGPLRSLNPPAIPISRCVRDEQLVERVASSGDRAVVLGVGYPDWITPNLARVQAVVQESASLRLRYGCSVERDVLGWSVTRCIRSFRPQP